MRSRLDLCLAATAVVLLASGCSRRPSASEAKAFLDQAEAKLFSLSEEASRAAWIQATYIIDDSEMVAARANQRNHDREFDDSQADR